MSSEIPEGVAIESVWALEASYGPRASELRPMYRQEHLRRWARLREEGTAIEVGAYQDMSASLILLRAEDEESALSLAHDDVYFRNGVWVEVRARRFGRLATTDELEDR